MELKVIGVVFLSGSEVPFEVYQVGKGGVKAIDKAFVQTGEVLITVQSDSGIVRRYITTPDNIIVEVEEQKITTAGIDKFLENPSDLPLTRG